ncbi:hypothetical protein [Arthrospira platensis]
MNIRNAILIIPWGEVIFKAPSPLLGEGFGVRAIPYEYQKRYINYPVG